MNGDGRDKTYTLELSESDARWLEIDLADLWGDWREHLRREGPGVYSLGELLRKERYFRRVFAAFNREHDRHAQAG